jgi:FMN phosphatase YigB (HAD superfamily)
MGDEIKFYLFVDLDDVLVDSHNDMNKDLVNAYGPKYDWALTVDAQKKVDEHLKALIDNHGARGKAASNGIKQIRDILQREGMYYETMRAMFREINTYAFDGNYYDDENEDFHEHLNKIEEYFIRKEQILDARDTMLFIDNHKPLEEHAVLYENYYTKERLMSNPMDANKPAVMDKLADEPEFDGKPKILTHYNGPNEGNPKKKLCKDCYPKAEFMPLFFHEVNKYNPKFRRPRFSKAKYAISEGYDIHRSILIDDSMENITAWVNAGGIGILYDPKHRYHENERYYVIHSFTHEEIMNVVYRIKDKYIRNRGKVFTK